MGPECGLDESRIRRLESEVEIYTIHWSQVIEVVNFI